MYTLTLSTEEIKTLQLILENVCANSYSFVTDLGRDLLTKITLVQLHDDEPTPYEKAHVLDANHNPDEHGPAY